jgi:hypothetical protein
MIFDFTNSLLPFWILGFPLVIAIINLVMVSRDNSATRSEHIPRTQPNDRADNGDHHSGADRPSSVRGSDNRPTGTREV